MLVVLQGMDASGKDGTIRKVFGRLNPQGCRSPASRRRRPRSWRTTSSGASTRRCRARATIGVFNRSHYEDVLVVRVHEPGARSGLAAALRADQRSSSALLTENGVTILKFFLHISQDEQRERLQARLDDPAKHWKFSAGDLEERDAVGRSTREAYEDALARTSTDRGALVRGARGQEVRARPVWWPQIVRGRAGADGSAVSRPPAEARGSSGRRLAEISSCPSGPTMTKVRVAAD